MGAGGGGGGGDARKREGTQTYHKNKHDGSSPILQPCVTAGQKPVCSVLYLMMPYGL